MKKLSKGAEQELVAGVRGLELGPEAAAPTGTGLACEERLSEFRCLWDQSFPECPERLHAVREKLAKYQLLERCTPVQARPATHEELLRVHSQEYLKLMESTQQMSEEELRALADTYDSVFLHPNSYACARLATGTVLQLVDMVMAGEVRNGLAVVRPPGHHAQRERMDGYCMFNHLAVSARHAQEKHQVERVLIVDWDVHHGQGTQRIFEQDSSVLYFSIHRYEHARFWPHLPESDWRATGSGRGRGYTVNVPWNQVGMRDPDYISAFLHLLLPIAFEFQPQLVLVAAGFDSMMGDPKGEMAATPACFAHLTHLLMGLAGGKLILSLEGGYNLRSLGEGTSTALKSLLGDSCPLLEAPGPPCQSALASVSHALAAHQRYWRVLERHVETPSTPEEPEVAGEEGEEEKEEEEEEEEEEEKAAGGPRPAIAPKELAATLDRVMEEVLRPPPLARTGLVYDPTMMEHYNMWDSHHPELPQRISRIAQRHAELGLTQRCRALPARLASDQELLLCHSPEYVEQMRATSGLKPRELHREGERYNSIYIAPRSFHCAQLAAGSACSLVEAVLDGQVRNGVAIVRPPGHHAERDTACGFCFFNSVAVAARHAQQLGGRPLRVLILDWDVHHGNGTQHMFEEDPSVLYVSLHRYDHGSFFPTSEDGDSSRTGRGRGEGFTLNVPWNGPRMGDPEYLTAFHRIIMPVAYEFNPELVLVSAGFDAARGDPLGGCQVTPEGYAHMTHLLMGLAGGRLVLVLEGGYNLSSISESMAMCTRTLLGDPPPVLPWLRPLHPGALESLAQVTRVHRKYWQSLRLNVPRAPEDSSPRRPAASGAIPKQRSSPGPAAGGFGTGPASPGPPTAGTTAERAAEEVGAEQTAGLPDGQEPAEGPPREEPGPEVEDFLSLEVLKLGDGLPEAAGAMDAHGAEPLVPEDGPQEPLAPEGSQDGELLGEAAGGCFAPTWLEVTGREQEEPGADSGTFCAVTPLPWCPHLTSVCPVPSGHLDVTRPCQDCGLPLENWVCLCCYQVHCGRYINAHMVRHFETSGHPLVLSFTDLSVWCYSCEDYVHHEALLEAKNVAHRLKFGEDMPTSQ
ncbi:histone deacetylase 6 isoform X2 [Tachyglossus aculeatus]|nr:histone deacetylase 6 isoform X2 [Tachyglossus aculeatus]